MIIGIQVLDVWDVGEVRKAHLCTTIPLVHRVDRFRQLGAAGFVDATGIDPEEFVPSFACHPARLSNLRGEARVIPDGAFTEYGVLYKERENSGEDEEK